MSDPILRTWRCTAGHLAMTVLEPEGLDTVYIDPPCSTEGCTLPTAERRPQEQEK